MPKLDLEKLNDLYRKSKEVDKALFYEQQSNVRLVASEHFSRKGIELLDRVRGKRDSSAEQKVRIVKNHLQRITKTIVGNILTHAPGVTIVPNNQTEIADQKTAALCRSVWEFVAKRNKFKQMVRDLCEDFVNIGEAVCMIRWDEDGGELVGYESITDPLTGEDVVDPFTGELAKGKPIYSGDIKFERIFAFNLLRDPAARSMDDAQYFIIRKMVDIKTLQKIVGEDTEKAKLIQSSAEKTYRVFNGITGDSGESDKDQVMVREFYWKPSPLYPAGHVAISTPDVMLYESSDGLPFGIWPFIYSGYEGIPTTPRSRSPIKFLRPGQSNINRMVGEVVRTQLSEIGKPTVLVQAGTKVTPQIGKNPKGLKVSTYQGSAPQIVNAVTGENYLPLIEAEIKDLYKLANLDADFEEKKPDQDPYAMLFSSIEQRKKYALYAAKFEGMLIEIAETALKTAKFYFDPETIIPMIGEREAVNIEQFKNTDPMSYQIQVVPASDDAATQVGKQLMINTLLQYTSNNLGKSDIGRIVRQQPFGNFEDISNSLLLGYDQAVNIMLQLDKGQMPPPEWVRFLDVEELLPQITTRMTSPEFAFADEEIKKVYNVFVSELQNEIAQRQQAEVQRQSQLIPMGGGLVKLDYYITTKEGKQKRLALPTDAVRWTIDKIQSQGGLNDVIQELDSGTRAEISDKLSQIPQIGGQTQGGGSLPDQGGLDPMSQQGRV